MEYLTTEKDIVDNFEKNKYISTPESNTWRDSFIMVQSAIAEYKAKSKRKSMEALKSL